MESDRARFSADSFLSFSEVAKIKVAHSLDGRFRVEFSADSKGLYVYRDSKADGKFLSLRPPYPVDQYATRSQTNFFGKN